MKVKWKAKFVPIEVYRPFPHHHQAVHLVKVAQGRRRDEMSLKPLFLIDINVRFYYSILLLTLLHATISAYTTTTTKGTKPVSDKKTIDEIFKP